MMTEALPCLSAAPVVPPRRDGRSPPRSETASRAAPAGDDVLTGDATVAEPELLPDPQLTKVTTLILIYA